MGRGRGTRFPVTKSHMQVKGEGGGGGRKWTGTHLAVDKIKLLYLIYSYLDGQLCNSFTVLASTYTRDVANLSL